MKPPGRQNNPAGMARQESAQVSMGDWRQKALNNRQLTEIARAVPLKAAKFSRV
jgi:hypothetical protein